MNSSPIVDSPLAPPPSLDRPAIGKRRKRKPSAGKTVRILNPPPGHRGTVGILHAARWVRQGRAEWIGQDLRLDDRHRKALARATSNRPQIEGFDYDRINRKMTLKEVANLPMLKMPKRRTRRR